MKVPLFDSLPGSALFILNDAVNLYLAMSVPAEMLLPEATFIILLDNDSNETIDEEDDIFSLEGSSLFRDTHFGLLPSGKFNCCFEDITQDGNGAVGHAEGVSFFEVAHPLNSGDPGDIAIVPGDALGFCVRYSDGATVISYPKDCQLVVYQQTLYKVFFTTPAASP